jgi:hypothetical protein
LSGATKLLVLGDKAPILKETYDLPDMPMSTPESKRAVFVLYGGFAEPEYDQPRAILEDMGVIVTVASSSLDIVKGTEGMEVRRTYC